MSSVLCNSNPPDKNNVIFKLNTQINLPDMIVATDVMRNTPLNYTAREIQSLKK